MTNEAWQGLSRRLAGLDLVLPELPEMLTPLGEGSILGPAAAMGRGV
jgi:hypothetical protein